MQKIIYLQEDWEKSKPENFIQGETHSPLPGRLRLVIPKWGAFYWDSLVVVDAITGDPVDQSGIKVGDLFSVGTERSGQEIYHCFFLTEAAPAAVRISYHGCGGPQSLNAHKLNEYYLDLMQRNATLNFADMTDFPDAVNPSYHFHQASHIFGWEYISDQVNRMAEHYRNTPLNPLEAEYQKAKNYLSQLTQRAEMTVEGIVHTAWREFEKEQSLFNLGLDMLRNYSAMGNLGVLAATPTFIPDDRVEEAYVDLRGLGIFSKELVKHILHIDSGNDLGVGTERDPHRGSILGAAIGDVFTLPSPARARELNFTDRRIYPDDFPEEEDMIITRIMANRNDLGGIFHAFSTGTMEQWIGTLRNEGHEVPLTWKRVYFSDEETPVMEGILSHISARGAVHEEDKQDLGLGYLENLPVIGLDNIVTRESKRMYLTYDTLMTYWRTHMESIKLERKANGDVDYDADLMDKTRVIIAGGCGDANKPPKDQFISSFCDGSDKYTRLSDGNGGYYDKLVELSSTDCNAVERLPYGQKLSEYCQGTNLIGRYADGLGGSFTETIKVNAVDCGYVIPPQAGSVLAVFCQGVNQITRYANGSGGTYDMTTMVNTYICGGKIYPSGGGSIGGGSQDGGSGGDGGSGLEDAVLAFKSSHERITPGTVEVLSMVASGLKPNTKYNFELVVKSPAINEGEESIIDAGSFTSNEEGGYIWTQQRLDNETTNPRGNYETWFRINSVNLSSNKIQRALVAGTGTTPPTDTNVPTPPPPAEGPGTVVPDDGLWPPVGVFDPKVILESTHNSISLGTNEILTASFSGLYSDEPCELQFYTSHEKLNNGAPTQTLSVSVIPTGRSGSGTFNVANYDDGTVPRGLTTDWVEISFNGRVVAKSAPISRLFVEDRFSTQWMQIKTISSHSVVYMNNAFTITSTITGGKPNTSYVLHLYRSRYSGTVDEANVIHATAQVTTDGSGSAYFDFQFLHNGQGAVADVSYAYHTKVVGESLISTQAPVRFSNRTGSTTSRTTISYMSDKTTIYKGDTERLTTSITDAPPNAVIPMEAWVQSPVINDGHPLMTLAFTVETNANGIGWHEISVVDDGTTVPRGNYQCYVVAPTLDIRSAPFTRTFAAKSGGGNTNSPIQLTLDTSSGEFKAGTEVICRIDIAGGKPNTNYQVGFMIAGDPMGNGGQAVRISTQSITTGSTGTASHHFTYTDNGTSFPRGTYVVWAELDGVQSSTLVRQLTSGLTGLNPRITFGMSQTTIAPGEAVKYDIGITGFRANSSFSFKGFIRGSATNNQPLELNTVSIVTDGNGNGSTSYWAPPDDGAIIPRGSYAVWISAVEVNAASAEIGVTYIAAATRPPTAVPKLSYHTSAYTITPGTVETHTIQISGGAANKSYTVDIYIQSPVVFNSTPFNTASVTLTTNASGNATHSFNVTDDGTTMPRGTYSNWAVIASENVSSATFTRVFASPAPKVGSIYYSSDNTYINIGSTENQVIAMSGWDPHTTYTLEEWASSSALPPPTTRHMGNTNITTDANGYGEHRRTLVEGGLAPAGAYDNWIKEVRTGVTSNNLVRTFTQRY